MPVTLLLFGPLVDRMGSNHLLIDDMPDTAALMQHLHQRYPALATTKFAIAVDKKIVQENTSLNNNTTVALLPPFSGG